MSHNTISIIVLGKGDSLNKALITTILGKDLSQLSSRNVTKETEIYENDIFVVTYTPDMYAACEDNEEVDANQHHDMSLLVAEDGFSTEEVSKQTQKLKEITGKEFMVVLPLRCTEPRDYPFRYYTIMQVFSELSKLAEKRHLNLTNKRPADNPEPDMSTSQTPVGMTGDRYRKDSRRSFQSETSVFKMSLNSNITHAGTTVNLVLLGMSGTGKSASGNTILREERFFSKASSNPITTECQQAETEIGGTRVHVIDTPDIFDDEIDSSVKDKHVTQCRQLCQSGPCVFLLVMHVSRFTDGERDILTKLEKAFNSKVYKQTVVLFTRGDDLKQAGMNLEGFLRSCQPDLKKVVEKCGNRCVVFENRDSDSHQVGELMKTVNKMLEEQQK